MEFFEKFNIETIEEFNKKFKKIVPRVKRAKKRLKHEKKYTKLWYKERNRLNRLLSNAWYLQNN